MSVQGIIGKKVGMTQVYADDGRAYPVTVIQAGPCVVVQRKAKDKDGYSAVQLGLVEARKTKKVTKPMKGHFDKAGLPPCRVLREFRVADGAELKVGDKVSVEQFAAGDKITVCGHQPRQGLPGRDQAPPLPRRRRDPRLDVPPRPRLDRRLGLSLARAAGDEGRGAHGHRQGDRRATSRSCGWTRATTCWSCTARFRARAARSS